MVSIAVEWQDGARTGSVDVSSGRLVGLSVTKGAGSADAGRFASDGPGPFRIDIDIDGENISCGANPTMVTVREDHEPFTFLLRDVSRACPIWIADYGVAVLEADDERSYAEIESEIRSRGLRTKLLDAAAEPEESYEDALAHTRSLRCPTWLGLGRDMRIFEVNIEPELEWHTIQPKDHWPAVTLPEKNDQPVTYKFTVGMGLGCVQNVFRSIEDRQLPILRGEVREADVTYTITSFASLESSPFTAETLRGTHFLVADANAAGNMLTPEQQVTCQSLLPAEQNRDEETVLYTRVEAVNTSRVPRYAWFKAPTPYETYERPVNPDGEVVFDEQTGVLSYASGRCFATVTLNGKPAPKEELAVLLQPGETAVLDFSLPHRPITRERALALAAQDFEARRAECRAYWLSRLEQAADVSLPEKEIEDRLRAGLLHLDLVSYGLEPDGPVAATIGVYCPIGSESSPIIQAMDSMGWSSLAERSLHYFIEKQHEDGFIQNFGGYMLETGPALWSMGEHFRYTRDTEWVRRITPNVLKACEFITAWRARNLDESLRGRGYGMIEGKVADPEDPYRAFMLNGYAYLGMSRAAEMLTAIGSPEADGIAAEAEALKADIMTAVTECLAKSPVVPIGDGSWCPSMPPWAEGRGPIGLLTDDLRWYTHAGFATRDSLVGPIYLAIQEVLDPNDRAVTWMLGYQAEFMQSRGVGLSQPYYSPHPYVLLKRGEVNAFLKAYYNGFASLADRETLTFWEHYHHASPHKTHEEGWFLMQTRWMLYMEDGDTLNLLPGIPRAWMENGKRITLSGARTYFGPVSLDVESDVDRNAIRATISCESDRQPKSVRLRLPHPLHRRASSVTGGVYDAEAECVVVDPFTGSAEIEVRF